MRAGLPIAALLLFASGGLRADETSAELDIIVHAASDVQTIDGTELSKIFRGTRSTLPDGSPAIAFNLPPNHGYRIVLDRVVLGMTPHEVGRYWVDQRIRGMGRPPKQVSDPALMAKIVAKLPGSIGYVPAGHAVAGTRIVARIRDHRYLTP